jgi:hypothetical protein
MGRTFPGSLEEEPDNKDLESSHRNHHTRLDHREIEDSSLRTPDRAEIAVLARPEVFLLSVDCAEQARQFEDGFLQDGGLFRSRALFGR